MNQSIHYQQGTTLVEVLVAAIIIAIGLLGIASLQVKSLQSSTNAEHRAIATDIAASLADRMRANIKSKSSYIVDPVDSCPPAPPPSCSVDSDGTGAPGSLACNTNSDTESERGAMANHDIYTVRCAPNLGLKNILPDGKLTVSCADSPCEEDSVLYIKVSWRVRDDALGDKDDSGNAIDFIVLPVIPGTDIGAP